LESNIILLNQSAVIGAVPVGYSGVYADNTDRLNVVSQTQPTQQIAYLSDIVGFNDNQIVSPDLLTKAECKDGDIFNVTTSTKPRINVDDTSTNLFTKSILSGTSGAVLRLNDDSTFSLSSYFASNGTIEASAGGKLAFCGGGAQTCTEMELVPPKITTSVFNGGARTTRHIIDQTTQTFYDSGNNERLKIDSNVTLNNLYQMPNTAGITGDTIIKSGIGSVWARPQVYGLFSATGTPVTVANTTAQTSLIPTGTGDGLTIPPNYLSAGMSFLLKCGGTFSDSAGSTQITFRLNNGGTLFSTGLLTLQNVPNTQIGWNIETQFTYIGGTQIITNFTFNYNNGSDAKGFTNQQVNNSLNTAISNTLNFTVQWAPPANPLNSITCNYFTLTKIF
jgi:hypothetical protein